MMLETIRFLIASSNAILISEKWVGDGELHLNFLWACPFGLLILAVLAPLGLMGPSWPFEPLLPCLAPIGLLSLY